MLRQAEHAGRKAPPQLRLAQEVNVQQEALVGRQGAHRSSAFVVAASIVVIVVVVVVDICVGRATTVTVRA